MSDLGHRVARRWLEASVDVSTPTKTADVLRNALASHFRDGYLLVEAERGVRVTAGRMSEEAFAKLRLTEGYVTPGHNPLATIILAPGFMSTAWENLEIRFMKGGHEATVLKALGIKPFRSLSGVAPEKGVKAVVAWYTANAAELKDPHHSIPIRY